MLDQGFQNAETPVIECLRCVGLPFDEEGLPVQQSLPAQMIATVPSPWWN